MNYQVIIENLKKIAGVASRYLATRFQVLP